LVQYGYNPFLIKLTEALSEPLLKKKLRKKVDSSSLEKRYSTSMDVCNELRRKAGNEIMAELAISKIVSTRKKAINKDDRPLAFIIRQIKRIEEVNLLRNIYGDRFILLSCFAPRELRCENLASLISEDRRSNDRNAFRDKAEKLIIRDEDESDDPFGQKVRNAFPNADVVINAKDKSTTDDTMNHFFKVFFGNPRISPTKDEYGLYMASAAALRSTDLSRQVGAAIFSENLEIVSLGSNEVPKYSGGTYLQDDAMETGVDGRDVAVGFDANTKIRIEIAKDAIYQISELATSKSLTEKEVEKIL